MKVKVDGSDLVIRIPMEKKRIDTAGNGKTLRVASSGGNIETDCVDPVSGKRIKVGLNAYVPVNGDVVKKSKKNRDDDED